MAISIAGLGAVTSQPGSSLGTTAVATAATTIEPRESQKGRADLRV